MKSKPAARTTRADWDSKSCEAMARCVLVRMPYETASAFIDFAITNEFMLEPVMYSPFGVFLQIFKSIVATGFVSGQK